MESCLAYALEHNQNVLAGEIDKQIAKADIGVFRSDGLPQLNANANFSNNFLIPQIFVPADAFGGPGGSPDETVAVQFGTDYNADAGFTLSQMIFDGSFFVGLEAARTYRQLSEKDQVKTKIDVVEAVSKAYYGVLINTELHTLYDSEYKRLSRLYRDTRKMYEQGFAERLDVQRLQVQLNNLETEKRRVANTLDISYQLLKFQMGLSMDFPLQIEGSLSQLSPQLALNQAEDFDYAQRIEYSQLQTNERLIELDMKNNRVQYLPSLDLFANLGWNTGTQEFSETFNFSNWVSSGTLGVRLQLPIFDGLRKSYQIQKNRLQLEQIDLYFNQLRNQIDMDISQASSKLAVNLQNMDYQRSNMEMANEIYDVTVRKYEEGVGTNLEVLDAIREKRQAENNYYAAVYDALIAKVDLDKATGKLLN